MNAIGNVVETREITELRRMLKGQVITPADRLYDPARAVFYGDIDRRPAAIARVANAKDVARVVALARQTGLELAVRSGGHSAAGFSVCDDGIVIDLRDMRAIKIDPEQRTVWAETGLTAGEVSEATGVYSLAVPFGDTFSVGIGGLTLGGGVGYLTRKFGLTIDNLLAAEIVSADGQLLRADARNHPALFWAIRGGGGNYGVVTRFKFQLQRVSTAIGGLLVLPATAETIADFVAAAWSAPEQLTTIANILPAPPLPGLAPEWHGRMVLMASLMFAGELQDGEEAMKPFQKIAAPLVDQVRSMRYAEILRQEEGGFSPAVVSRTLYLNGVDRAGAGAMLEHLRAVDGFRAVQLRVLGGAAARVPVEESAYAHRQAPILANLVAFHNNAEERALRQAWVDAFVEALPQKAAGAYVNFVDGAGRNPIGEVYPGKTGERLAQIKKIYDPQNLFRRNHNIQPL